ncbi:MAG: acetylornithine transaminase [Verrucomicrobiae bacterium]|nr:acetylornithine transaminase [Verrucomicrobiae bacterium]
MSARVEGVGLVNEFETEAKAREIIELHERYVLGTYRRLGPVLGKGQGTEVWDIGGRRYLDFGGGIAVNSLGHAHPALVSAIREQAAHLIHVSNLYYCEQQGVLAKRIVDLTGAGRVFFCNSGAEANEAQFKLARRLGAATGRFEIITCQNSFHGRTLAGIAATGQERFREGFGPVTPGFRHVPFNDLTAIERAAGPETVGVLIEGIQGEGGIHVASAEYLLGLRRLCDERGLLLLWDGVQCGMFRTGRFQSFQRLLEGVPGGEAFLPDAIAMAKGLGGGYPIGALWVAERHAALLGPGSHGCTFGGSPLACAAALAVLDTVARDGLMENARRQGERALSSLRRLAAELPAMVADVRGLGCMVGIELRVEAAPVVSALAAAGLLVVPSGKHVVRMLAPLNVSDAEMDEALSIIAGVFRATGGGAIA